jgi:predicted dehydrogenase
MTTPVKIAVVGFGNFGCLHARTLESLAEAELVGIVDANETSLQRAAAQFPGVAVWGDLNHAIDQCDAEAWIVASSTASHVPIAKALLAAGRHVLVEKPLATNLAEAESLADFVDAGAQNLMLAHILLFNSEFRQLCAEAKQRGPLVFIDAVRHRPTQTLAAFPGESPLHLTMIHDLYCVQALTGGEEPAKFNAQLHHNAADQCDLAVAQIVWPSGLVASFTASFLTPPGMPSDGFDRLEVFGEGWSARVRSNPRPLELWDERAHSPLTLEIFSDVHQTSGMLAEELRTFCRVVRSQQQVPLGARCVDALQLLRWLEQLEASARGA